MEGLDVHARWQRRIDDHANDRQALADIHLELQSELGIDREQETQLSDRIEDLIAELGGWYDLLPSPLELCRFCGKTRDRAPGGNISLCLCAGIVCGYCGAGQIHRPISSHYELDDHRLWHTPYFGAGLGCRWCRVLREELAPEISSWGSQVETPAMAAVLRPLRAAGDALSRARFARGDALPSHKLVALRGDVEAWHRLRLGAPPDGRPLYVGRSIDQLDLPFWPPDLRIATWTCSRRVDVGRVLHELLVRWQPPLNAEIETPWRRR